MFIILEILGFWNFSLLFINHIPILKHLMYMPTLFLNCLCEVTADPEVVSFL